MTKQLESTRLRAGKWLLGTAVCALLAAPAFAAEPAVAEPAADAAAGDPAATSDTKNQIEEIMVTARKVSEPLQKVPSSISVISADDLAAAGKNSFEDLIASVPNVAMSGGIAGTLQGQVGIRGVSTLVRNIGVESGVGIYVDGVYMGRSDNYNQELIDTEQVEVLRGPQGTLFGKNTIAGVFNITTVRPTDEVQGVAKVEAGDYGLIRTQGYVTAPIVPGVLSGKLSVGYVSRDGVYDNLSGGKDGDALDQKSVRGTLYFTPSAQSEFDLSFDGLRDRGEPAYFQAMEVTGISTSTKPLTIDPNRQDYLNRDNYGLSLTGKYDFSAGTLTSISAFRHSAYHASLDDDQNQIDYAPVDKWSDVTEFFSQELRFNGEIGSQIDYVVGAYFYDGNVKTDRALTVGEDFLLYYSVPSDASILTNGEVKTRSYAAFGNMNMHFTDKLTLGLGLRYNIENRDANFTQTSDAIAQLLGYPTLTYNDSRRNHDLSPTATLSYSFAPEVMGYVRVARGFKSAAFNVDLVGSTMGLSAGPEEATTYEAGVKTDFFSHRLRANAAVFRTKYDDMQVSQLLGTGVTLSNAGKATIDGAELELTAFVADGLRLEGSAGYLNATYDSFENCTMPTSLGGGVTDCSGKRIIGAPKWTYHLAAEYTYPVAFGDLVTRVDLSGQTPVFYEATNSSRFESDSRSVIDARVGLKTEQWDVFVWGKNLGDETYITYMDDRSGIGVPLTTAFGEPRTLGATLTVRF